MSDPLSPDLRLFVNELKAALPSQISISQDLDTTALQNQLEQQVDAIFKDRYRKIEADIGERLRNLEKSVNTKVADVNKFQGQEQDHIQRLIQQLKEQQEQQGKLIAEISDSVARRRANMEDMRNTLQRQLGELQEKVEELSGGVKRLKNSGGAPRLKEKVDLSAPSLTTSDGNQFLIVQATNRKDYDLAQLYLKFAADERHAEVPVQWIQISENDYSPFIPGKSTATLWVQDPQIEAGLTIKVSLYYRPAHSESLISISREIDFNS